MKVSSTYTFALCILSTILASYAVPVNKTEVSNRQRFLPIVNVIQFPNEFCQGSGNRNGTCFTADECESNGGTSSGSCASGYGVCCIISLSCGESSSLNNTYLLSTNNAAAGTNCAFKICRSDASICRIRLDFTTFVIASPANGVSVTEKNGGAIGDCLTDAFSIAGGSGSLGSPVICGVNTGQHMIVDAGDMCNMATFVFGSGSATRNFDIKVTQYACGDEFGGPPGCLQYFRETTGVFSSFNFPDTATIPAPSPDHVHLSNQNYQICIRRNPNYCSVCYTPTIIAADPRSFGLSAGTDNAAKSSVGTNCSDDYITIPNGIKKDGLITEAAANSKFCGRFLNAKEKLAATTTVCTFSIPFRVGFTTDSNELSTAGNAKTNEIVKAPAGYIGFKLTYIQRMC